jgi:hypothetical protein
MTTPAADVTIGTLQLPAALMPRVAAALRDQYDAILPDGTTDDAVAGLVLRYVIETSLETYEARKVVVDVEEAVEKVRAEHRDRAEKAREQVRKDAQAIREARKAPAKRAAKAK